MQPQQPHWALVDGIPSQLAPSTGGRVRGRQHEPASRGEICLYNNQADQRALIIINLILDVHVYITPDIGVHFSLTPEIHVYNPYRYL